MLGAVSEQGRPEQMRQAMADYVATVHQAYLSQAEMQAPAVRGNMPLLADPFTVVAAGVSNLHVIATREKLVPPEGPEVAVEAELGPMCWTLHFYDPVVLPQLGVIDESQGPAGDLVRRALGISTHLYHLIVQPGSQLTGHHAGHAGSGLANAHVAEARDIEEMRSLAPRSSLLIDELEGATRAGLPHAQALLASRIATGSQDLANLANEPSPRPDQVRRMLLESLRGSDGQ